jgi:hypothetical protein
MTDELFERIVSSLRKKERDGFRHLWLGDSGMGKTTANRALIQYVLAHKLVDIVLTIDDKNRWRAQYDGTQRVNPAHLSKQPLMPGDDHRQIVFRGIASSLSADEGVDPEDVAQMGWDLVRLKPCSVLINVDELADATNGHQSWMAQTMPQLYRKGRGVGLSVTATTQMPQLLPREAFGLSDTIGIFRMTGREAEYLWQFRVVDQWGRDTIPSLEVGQFLLFQKSVPPDHTIHKLKI